MEEPFKTILRECGIELCLSLQGDLERIPRTNDPTFLFHLHKKDL